MSRKLLYLIKVSLNKKIKTKWFLIANVLFFVLIVGLINIDYVIEYFGGDFEDKTYIYFYDSVGGENFSSIFESYNSYLGFNSEIEYVDSYDEGYELISKTDDDNKIFVYLDSDDVNYMKASIISNNSIDSSLYQIIVSSLNEVKREYALSLYGLSSLDMALINSSIEVDRVKLVDNDNEDNSEIFMSVIFPVLTLPIFMLTMFLVQMIGAEINEEKSTRGMEIIISNVSPKIHFLAKLVSGNVFVILQGLLLVIYLGVGIFIRMKIGGGLNLESLVGVDVVSGMEMLGNGFTFKNLGLIILFTLLLVILSFVGYSLLSAICASMTTSMEDYQQVQTPIIMISLVGYYLALMASVFSGSLFIRVFSYFPFISTMLSPALLLLGQIGIVDVIIAIVIQLAVIYLLVKYGLRIYKVGILNYSNSNIWKKMFKAVVRK